MQRAVLRETAVRSIDTLATDTDIVVPQKQGSLSAHVTGQHHAKVGRDGTPVLNETSINALMQVENKPSVKSMKKISARSY